MGRFRSFNVFASWCVACREEHPLLMRLSREEVRSESQGINYKDAPEDAARWLDTMGDPYTRTGADRNGTVAIDWGVYGVPRTFVVGADGVIAHRHIGAITDQALAETLLPLIRQLRRGPERRGRELALAGVPDSQTKQYRRRGVTTKGETHDRCN